MKPELRPRKHQKWEDSGTNDNRVAWKLAIDFLYQVYNEVEEKELEKKIRAIEATQGTNKYGEAWKVVNEVTSRKKAKEVSGNSPEERVTTWFSHFKNFEDLDIKDDLFIQDEFKKVKSSLKIGKAAGPNNIPPLVFKFFDFDDICLSFYNKALLENDKPDLWSFMNIIPVPKSGDLTNTNNYRG